MNFDVEYLKNGIKKVISVHAISILITAFMTFFAPKFLDTYDYGLWQLYVFYFGYIGFFHLGFVDGLYLELIGKKYEKIDKKSIKSKLFIFFIFQFLVAIGFIFFSLFLKDIYKSTIIRLLAITLIITNVRYFFVYILQACGKVNEYSNIQLTERVLFVVLFIIFVRINSDFKSIIYADIFSKLFSLFLSIYFCKDIFTYKIHHFFSSFDDFLHNIDDGSKLMIANIVSMLTTGIIKFAIEHYYGVIEFGKVSLALTFSNLCVSILNSMGIVFIPLIKNKNKKVSSIIYDDIHIYINIFTFFAMVFYYPVKIIASSFLPSYIESFNYLAITFPIMYFCCVQSLLLVTYIKAFRQEKEMMYINMFCIVFSLIYSFVVIKILNNFVFCVFGISLIYFLKVTFYEYIVSKKIGSEKFFHFFFESIIMCVLFSVFNYYVQGILGMLLYFILFIFYIAFNHKYIIKAKRLLNFINS